MIAAWKLPPIIAAIAVAIVGGFYLGGPGLGMAVGALAAASIVVLAVRNPPRGPIWPAPLQDFRRHLLIVVEAPLEDPEAIARIAELARNGEPRLDEAEVRVLALARRRFLDRWTSDRDRAYRQANETLVLTLASLAKAGIAAKAKIGDEDTVQAMEDELREFPATDVVLVKPGSGGGRVGDAALSGLESRLQCDLWCIPTRPAASSRKPRSQQPPPAWRAAGVVALMGLHPWPPGVFRASLQSLESPRRTGDRR